jgi:hypothetical protein
MAINTEKEKRRNAHCRAWNMTRKQKNVENETHTLFHLEYGRKHSKTWKIRNAHCMSWIIEKKKKN